MAQSEHKYQNQSCSVNLAVLTAQEFTTTLDKNYSWIPGVVITTGSGGDEYYLSVRDDQGTHISTVHSLAVISDKSVAPMERLIPLGLANRGQTLAVTIQRIVAGAGLGSVEFAWKLTKSK